MSWNSTFVVINRDYSARIDQLEMDFGINLGEPLQTISWEEATSTSAAGKSVGFTDGWTIICAPFMFFDETDFEAPESGKMWAPKIENGLEVCSKDSRAIGFVMSGVSGTYGMTFHKDGARLRCRLIQEGETLIDFGEPLAEEIEAFNQESDEEFRVFLLLEKFGLSFEELDSTNFTLYQPTA